MATTLTRDRIAGKLFLKTDATAASVTVLRGGSYDLFHDPGFCPAAIGRRSPTGSFQPHIVPYDRGANPCQTEEDGTRQVEMDYWRDPKNAQGDPANDFSEFFRRMAATRCNFVRVFLTGATKVRNGEPATISPFVRETVPGGVRYDVRGAVTGRWNDRYFARLHAFVRQADAAGVVVQLALFNYREMDGGNESGDVKTWSYSPWNKNNSMHPAWAESHLIPANTPPGNRQSEFVAPPEGRNTRRVQQALIDRVTQTVAGFGNVVLEVMNEPRATLAEIAAFNSFVAGRIVALRPGTGAGPRISVNASVRFPEGSGPTGTSDMELWRRRTDLPHYAEVDLVSYHEMTAMEKKPLSACGGVNIPRLDTAAINQRASRFLADHSARDAAKALMFSTDAVNVEKFAHKYRNATLEMNVREGQIRPVPEPADGENLGTQDLQLLRGHVYHWARWSFERGSGADLGRIHLHNDATFRLPLVRIAKAAQELGLPASTVEAPESEVEMAV